MVGIWCVVFKQNLEFATCLGIKSLDIMKLYIFHESPPQTYFCKFSDLNDIWK